MRAEYINPFVTSLVHTFDTMLGCKVVRKSLALKQGKSPGHDVSGVIGLSGEAVGTVVVSFSRAVALKSASAMLLAEYTELNNDVIDAVGEITNMVAGAAKAQLDELRLSMSLPNVITGVGHEVRFPSNAQPIAVLFECPWGPLTLEVGLAPVAETVGV